MVFGLAFDISLCICSASPLIPLNSIGGRHNPISSQRGTSQYGPKPGIYLKIKTSPYDLVVIVTDGVSVMSHFVCGQICLFFVPRSATIIQASSQKRA